MELIITPESIMVALGIFAARTINQTIDTLRFMMTIRGRKLIAWVLGFTETVIFVITLSAVFSNLNNILYIVAYSAGFATGNTFGIMLEERLAVGHQQVRIVSSKKGAAIAKALRKEGYGVTEISARGRSGAVRLLEVGAPRRNVKRIHQLAQDIDENAFISSEDIRPLWRGFWGRQRK